MERRSQVPCAMEIPEPLRHGKARSPREHPRSQRGGDSSRAACHLTHTHPLLLILHQYFLQSHLLAGQAMLCLKHLPAGGEGDPKPVRPWSPGPPRPQQERRAGGKGLTGGAGPGIEGTRPPPPPTTRSLRTLSEPLLSSLRLFSPGPLPGRPCSPHKPLSAPPPRFPSPAPGSSPPASSAGPRRDGARPSKTGRQV